MSTLKALVIFGLTLLSSVHAQDSQFFRLAGPVPTTIIGLSTEGRITWENTPTNSTFVIQTASGLVGLSNWVDYVQVKTTNGITIHKIFDPNSPANMAFIPAGVFRMGPEEYVSGFEVYVSAFHIDRTEVTKALWDEVRAWATNNGYSFDFADSGLGKAGNHPAHSMTWFDCAKWCNARSEKEGKTPAYYTDPTQLAVYRSGQANLSNACVNWTAGYRLPTEAEWEKAARGGLNRRRFPWNQTNITHSLANYNSDVNSSPSYDTSPTKGYHPTFATGGFPYTSPAGYFQPNGYGLYDVAGNVEEFCWDWSWAYTGAALTDPRGPDSGQTRQRRGGSWFFGANQCPVGGRNYVPYLSYRANWTGFRSVLPDGQ